MGLMKKFRKYNEFAQTRKEFNCYMSSKVNKILQDGYDATTLPLYLNAS